MTKQNLRTLIVDDSAIIRGLLEKALASERNFTVVGSVSNGRKAVDFAHDHDVDVVISDIDMPELNGLEALKILTGQMEIPVVIFSENRAAQEEAVRNGAILFEHKPHLSAYTPQNLRAFAERVHSAAQQKLATTHRAARAITVDRALGSGFKILCLGASTGGPTAVQAVLSGLGSNFPLPVLYVQHIDIGSDKKMVDWFCTSCPNIPVHLAADGKTAKPGHVYMAPADRHLIIDFVTSAGLPVMRLSDEPEERFLRPAVNKLFRSAATRYKNNCLAVLLTGMGRDGAEGCQMIVENGGHTIAEDKSTCAVFGMPAAAIELNAATEVLPRQQIAERVLHLLGRK